MVTKLSIIVLVLAAIMVVSAIVQFHRKKITASWALFWSGLWVLGTAAVFFTGLLDQIGNYLIGSTGSQLVLYTAVLVLFFLVYRLFLTAQKLNESISKLVEELAKKK